MKSYCWDNKGKEETEKYEFVKKYAEWIENPRQGECPYSDPDEVNNKIDYVKNHEFYNKLTDFLNRKDVKIDSHAPDFLRINKLEKPKQDESKGKPYDRTISITLNTSEGNTSEGELHLHLTSDQFGFSANKEGIYDEKNHKLNEKYPFVKYVKNGGVKSLVGETIWNTRTIGGSFLWPKVKCDRNWQSSYNLYRGVDSYIEDRVDLTLYEIKEFYDEYSVEKDYEKIKDKLSEKGSNLLKYSDAEYIYKWLSIFKNFKTYVDFFCFDDFVNKEDDEYYPKDIFTGKSITKDNISEYREKGKSKYKFIQNKATKNDLEKAFYNLIFWTIARSARMETIISNNDKKNQTK